MSPSILVISFSNLATDPRVNRQLRLLRSNFRVTAAGFADPGLEGVEFVPLPSNPKRLSGRLVAAARLKLRRFSAYYWNIDTVRAANAAFNGRSFDLILANDCDTWPLAIELRGHARLLFDAHEYAPKEFEDIWWWRWLVQPYRFDLCARCLPQANAITTVCDGIAAEYARCFGVRRPTVVMNVPPRRDAAPTAVPPDRVRMIHHGAAIRSRRIEMMVQALDYLDGRFSLDLMLVGSDARYLAELRRLAQSRPRVRFRPAVPMQRIPEETRDYEVGLFLLEPTNFNYEHALPNKLFEFVQARLAVAIGPSPEMSNLVRTYDCGLVAADFSPVALARALSGLTPEKIEHFKRNAHLAADALCWELEGEKLRAIVRQLLTDAPCAA